MVTNAQSNTRIDEIADAIYRIHTPVPVPEVGGFSFNQYLVVDEAPLLFHTGLRRMFPLVREAIAAVMPVERLRWIGFSHFEADECGALNELLAAAPGATAVCSRVGAMTSIGDIADRPPRTLADGEALPLGRSTVTWLDAPHLPHGWDCGFLFERRTRTLLCGDLFTQAGPGDVPLMREDVLGPSEQMRRAFDYFSHGVETRSLLAKLAATEPAVLACMHGSAFGGDGAAQLRALADSLERR